MKNVILVLPLLIISKYVSAGQIFESIMDSGRGADTKW